MVIIKDTSSQVDTWLTETELREFKEIFPEIIQELVKLSDNTYPESSGMSRMTEWMTRVIDYNVSSEPTYLGGCLVPGALKCIMNDAIIPQKEMKFAYLMGWGLEFCHGARIMSDDIIDRSNGPEMIEGKLAWHTIDNIGMTAINDTFILRMANYSLLKIYFAKEPYFFELQDIARDGLQRCILGRAMWEQMEKMKPVSKGYTLKRYRQVLDFMLNYYSFYMPFESAFLIANKEDDPEFKEFLKDLMLQIGYYYQMRHDYDNIFGKRKMWTEKASGKLRRLTWFFATALEILSSQADGVNEDKVSELVNFTEDEKVDGGEKLRGLYKRLGLIEHFNDEIKLLKDGILEKVKNIPEDKNISGNFFHCVLATVENQTM